ncbi:hypothetical protein AB0E81_31350 [Streptomyces sp. NPDC033538]|uniref:hypothetical protein n=1 Tax=Streptomyces sp. NPDC033538 TaxID=3155367 RepID=UPI0033FDEA54
MTSHLLVCLAVWEEPFVQDRVKVLAWGNRRVELVEEGGEGHCVVSGDGLGEDRAGAHVQSGYQGRGAK